MVALAPVQFECWSEKHAEFCPEHCFYPGRIAAVATDPLKDVCPLVILRIAFFLLDIAPQDELIAAVAIVAAAVEAVASAYPALLLQSRYVASFPR